MLDALVEGCRRLQTADVLPTSHSAVPRLTLMMSLTDLQATFRGRDHRDRRAALRLHGATVVL